MFEILNNISVRKQAELLMIPRSFIYYKPVICDDTELINLIKEIYLESNCLYGYRKIEAVLKNKNYNINHKRILRIMNESGICGHYPRKKFNTSLSDKNHKIYPYLLKGLEILRPDEVWATDITYIKIDGKFMYLISIIDLYSRYILAWELSNTIDVGFCIFALQKALSNNKKPKIFNTDQGSQFTSENFTSILINNKIAISMDHVGRCFDNIFVERFWRTLKQEAVYYRRPETVLELEKIIDEFILWYNNDRLHQGINYKTPSSRYVCG